MHDSLFGNQQSLDPPALEDRARSIGLRMPSFDDCIHDPGTRDAIQSQFQSAVALKVTSTPTFMIGRILADGRMRVDNRLAGAHSAASISRALEEQIGKGG